MAVQGEKLNKARSRFLRPSVEKCPQVNSPLSWGWNHFYETGLLFQWEERVKASGSSLSGWGGGTCCVFYKPRNHGLILLEKKCFGVCVCVFNCIKWRNKIPGVWNWLTAKCLKTQEMKISSTVWVFWPISAESLLEMFCSVITRNAEYGTLDQYCCFLVPYMQSLRGTGSPFPHWLPNSEWQHLVPWGRAVAEQSIYFLKMNMQIIPLTF